LGFPTKTLYTFLSSSMCCSTCPVYLILCLMISGDEYNYEVNFIKLILYVACHTK
jgi:hypothetical protein